MQILGLGVEMIRDDCEIEEGRIWGLSAGEGLPGRMDFGLGGERGEDMGTWEAFL